MVLPFVVLRNNPVLLHWALRWLIVIVAVAVTVEGSDCVRLRDLRKDGQGASSGRR